MAVDDPRPENGTTPPALHERQVAALERVAGHIAPDVVARRWQRFLTKMLAVSMLGVSALLAGYELSIWMYESWQTRKTVNTWLEVAREVYEVEGNDEVAQEFLARAADISPQNASVIQLQAYIEGMGAMETLLNLDRPWNRAELNQADMAKANAILLHQLAPHSPDGSILRGQVTAALHDHDRAVGFLEQAMKIDPESAFARVRLAMVHIALAGEGADEASTAEHVQSAQRLLAEARALDPESKMAALWQSVLDWEVLDKWDSARQWLDRACTIDPRFALAHLAIGQLHLDKDEFPEAIAGFDRTLELRPEMPMALVGLAWAYGYQDQYETALQYSRRANRADPGFLEGWQITGLLSSEVFKLDGEATAAEAADKAFSQALELDPTNPQWYWQRSELRCTMGELRGAGRDARLGTLFGPEDAYAWMHLGHFQIALDPPMREQAIASYARALELDESLDDARRGTAKSLAALGRTEAALLEFNHLVEHSSEDVRAVNLEARAKFHEDQGDMPTAIADYRAARLDDPELFDAWFGEARVAMALHDHAAAHNAINACRQLRPGDAHVKTMADQLGRVTSTEKAPE
jgi:tetratricopeptide (TPR) repeat protein